jgi:hypothetical protein
MENLGKEEQRTITEDSCRDLAIDLNTLQRSIKDCQEFELENTISSSETSSPKIHQISFQIYGSPGEFNVCTFRGKQGQFQHIKKQDL